MTGRDRAGRRRSLMRRSALRTSTSPLSRTYPDDHLVGLVEWVEFRRIYFFDGQPLQKRRRGEDVSIMFDEDIIPTEALAEQSGQRFGRKRPEPRSSPLAAIDLTDAGSGDEHNPAWRERTMKPRHRKTCVVDEMQCLGEHNAIECIGREHCGIVEVADKGGSGIAFANVQHVGARYSRAAEPPRVVVAADLEHATGDLDRVPFEKTFDVV